MTSVLSSRDRRHPRETLFRSTSLSGFLFFRPVHAHQLTLSSLRLNGDQPVSGGVLCRIREPSTATKALTFPCLGIDFVEVSMKRVATLTSHLSEEELTLGVDLIGGSS